MTVALQKFDLHGKTAFITGGGTGLGYVMARGLANLGAKVMIASRRVAVLERAATKLADETGATVLYSPIDLADRNSVAAVAERVVGILGGVDIFIGNGGQDGLQLIEETDDDTVERLFQVNTLSNIALARGFIPHMRKKRWGRIIFSNSATAKCGTFDDGMGAYAATKGALNAFTRVAASETGHDGITVNSVIFGVFLTEIVQGVLDSIEKTQGAHAAQAFLKNYSCMTAVGHLGMPDDVAGVIQLLASDAGRYITGAEIPVDGGLTITMKPHYAG